jgi:hypothetical protein
LLQKPLKELVTGNFEFCNTRNGTRVVTKEMADFSAIKSHFNNQRMSYFTFYPKSQKPVKAVTEHLPHPTEDIYDGLMSLGFDVISVKQMTTNRQSSAEGTTTVNLTLFLITLPRMTKSQDIFTLSSICHIAIKVSLTKPRMFLHSVTAANSLAKYGQIASNLPIACGVGTTTCTRIVQRKRTLLQHRHAATASWLKERQHILPTIGAVGMQKKRCKKGSPKEHPRLRLEGCALQIYDLNPVLCSGSSRQLRTKEATTSTTGSSSRSDRI